MKSIITEKWKNESKTAVNKNKIALDNAEKLVEDIVNGKNNKSEVVKRYNNIVDDVNIIVDSRATKAQTKMIEIFK